MRSMSSSVSARYWPPVKAGVDRPLGGSATLERPVLAVGQAGVAPGAVSLCRLSGHGAPP